MSVEPLEILIAIGQLPERSLPFLIWNEQSQRNDWITYRRNQERGVGLFFRQNAVRLDGTLTWCLRSSWSCVALDSCCRTKWTCCLQPCLLRKPCWKSGKRFLLLVATPNSWYDFLSNFSERREKADWPIVEFLLRSFSSFRNAENHHNFPR